MGQRVPWRALQAVLGYLSSGHVDLLQLAGPAAGPGAQQHQAAAAVAKEVAALAVGLGALRRVCTMSGRVVRAFGVRMLRML